MKKLLPAMIGAVLAGGMTAAQADITVFGHIDSAVVSHDADKGFVTTGAMPTTWQARSRVAGANLGDNIDDVNFVCTTCSIGFKGSEDLGNGLKAIFYLDFQYDIFNRNVSSLLDRDQWLGLAGNFGQVRFGTISTPYKSHGAMIDPLYRTAVQGRTSGLQSFLHNNAGEDGEGRADNTVRWDSPSYNGFQVAAFYTLDSSEKDGRNLTPPGLNPTLDEDDDGYGIGAQYTNGGILVFADYLTNDSDDLSNANGELKAWKVGGKYTINNFAVMGQYENVDDAISIAGESGKQEFNMWHIGGSYTMGNNMLYAGYGMSEATDLFNNTAGPKDDSEQTAFTIAGVHSLSKRTSVYAAYNKVSQDNDALVDGALQLLVNGPTGQGGVVSDPDMTTIAVGMKHKF